MSTNAAAELGPKSGPELLAEGVDLPCGVRIPNRIGKAALSEQLADARNRPTEALITLYERWAEGGAGLLLTGNVMIDGNALEEPRNVVVEDDRDLALLRRWAAAATSHGAQCFVQLSHPGRQSMRTLSWTPVAPSAVSMKFGRGLYAKPRALLEHEIRDIIARFARSAAVLKEAGFSGVQLHAAHGYLISAFLSPLTNQRTDRWGGSVENRQRFLFEVYRATRDAVGPDFPIAIKLNSADFQRGGFTEDESMQVVRRLEQEGIDLIEISGGSYESAAMMGLGGGARESTRAREAYFLEYAEQVRAITDVPLMLTGGFRSMEGMAHAVSSDAIDVVGLGRPLCMEPDLPRLLLAGELSEYPVAPRRMGVKELDTILEVFWFTQQLHLLAKGKNADPGRGNLLALIRVGVDALIDTVRLRLRV